MASANAPEPDTDRMTSEPRSAPDLTGVSICRIARASRAAGRTHSRASSDSARSARPRTAAANSPRSTRSPHPLRPVPRRRVIQGGGHDLDQPRHLQRQVPRPPRVIPAPDDPYGMADSTAGGAGRGLSVLSGDVPEEPPLPGDGSGDFGPSFSLPARAASSGP